MHAGQLSFGTKRRILEELKGLERQMLDTFGVVGWLSWTGITDTGVMQMFRKVGAQPYMMTKDRIYFMKRLKEVS